MQRLLLRLAAFAAGLYYRREHLGEAVPATGPVVLVGNHPNGLVDPVLIAGCTERPVRFLGKAPLFDMPVIGLVMRGLEALPVYRPQDGADTARNRDTFEAVYAALADGDVLCLFPEGTSHADPALHRLKTGAARMALGAEAQRGFELGVRVVPVGLVYRASRRFRSHVAVWVGEPIDARDFRDEHARDDRRAVELLTERIAEDLRAVTLQLDRWEDLPLLELAERIHEPGAEPSVVRVRRFAEGVRELRARDPEPVDRLGERIAAFRERLSRLGLSVEDLDRPYRTRGVVVYALRSATVLLLGLPLALAGVLLWFVPYRLTPPVARLARPSREIHATVQILAGSLLFTLWLAVLVGAAWLSLGWAASLLALVGAPLVGLFALDYLEWRREIRDDTAIFLLLARRGRLREHLRRERDALASAIADLRSRL